MNTRFSCRPVIKNEKLIEIFIAYVFPKHMAAERRRVLRELAQTSSHTWCAFILVCVYTCNHYKLKILWERDMGSVAGGVESTRVQIIWRQRKQQQEWGKEEE